MEQYTTREAARTSLLHHAATKVQALRKRIEKARLGHQYHEDEMRSTEEYIHRQQYVLAQAEAAELYFNLTLTDEALAHGRVVVCLRPDKSTDHHEKLLLLSSNFVHPIQFRRFMLTFMSPGIPQRIGEMDRQETTSSCPTPSAFVPTIHRRIVESTLEAPTPGAHDANFSPASTPEYDHSTSTTPSTSENIHMSPTPLQLSSDAFAKRLEDLQDEERSESPQT